MEGVQLLNLPLSSRMALERAVLAQPGQSGWQLNENNSHDIFLPASFESR